MEKVHPYRHMRPRRVEIAPADPVSYSASRYAEDQDIRYSFGHCGRTARQHIQVVEIDYAWLGVVFHIVVTSEKKNEVFTALEQAKDDVASFKQVTKDIILKFLLGNPDRLPQILETIHEASREQGHLEVVKHTVGAMDASVDFTDL